jgi:hypothetical protein
LGYALSGDVIGIGYLYLVMLNEVTIKAIGEFRCGQIFERKYKKFQTRCSSKSIISIIKKIKNIH